MTVAPALVTAATDSIFSNSGLLDLLAGAAAALATLGLLLLLPLYLTHRREVLRLLDWMDREPDAGTTEFRAVPPAGPATEQWQAGAMTPAERVTSERPALARISTAEHAALDLERAPLWRRMLERGPRHPLVLTLLALLIAGGIFVAAAMLIRSTGDDTSKGGGLDPASVEVVVVNAAKTSGVAGEVGSKLSSDGFSVTSTTVASDPVKQSSVLYADGQKPAGRAVTRALGLAAPLPFDPAAEAAANGADVVVVAGDDAQAAAGGKKG